MIKFITALFYRFYIEIRTKFDKELMIALAIRFLSKKFIEESKITDEIDSLESYQYLMMLIDQSISRNVYIAESINMIENAIISNTSLYRREGSTVPTYEELSDYKERINLLRKIHNNNAASNMALSWYLSSHKYKNVSLDGYSLREIKVNPFIGTELNDIKLFPGHSEKSYLSPNVKKSIDHLNNLDNSLAEALETNYNVTGS